MGKNEQRDDDEQRTQRHHLITPTNNARISAIRRMLPEVMPIYEQSRR